MFFDLIDDLKDLLDALLDVEEVGATSPVEVEPGVGVGVGNVPQGETAVRFGSAGCHCGFNPNTCGAGFGCNYEIG